MLVPVEPWTTETEVGEAEIANEPAAVTVRLTVAVCVVLPAVPVTVMVYVPAATVEATVIVIVDVPEPGAAMDAGLKPTVTPVGSPEAVRAIAELSPPETAVVIVEVPLLPCTKETEVGVAAMVKFGDVDTVASEVMSALPFGLPQPVTRSNPVTAE